MPFSCKSRMISENRSRYGLPTIIAADELRSSNHADLTFWQADTVAFVIQQTADLREITLALHGVLDRRRLHEKCIGLIDDTLDAVLCTLHEYIRIAFHVFPHFLVRRNARFLEGTHRERCDLQSAEKLALTRKNCSVEPAFTTPYLIFVCFTKSSALSIGLTSFSTVRNAANGMSNKSTCGNRTARSSSYPS